MKKSKSNYKDIDVSDYSLFYSECFGGFEDLDDSEDGSEGESDDDNYEEGDIVGDVADELIDDDYKPGEESEDSYEYKSDNSCELDIDLNTY